ncbi:MAG: hypothetical protein JSW64_08585 [Candidatus Zixiibacteriota bacterium]|nr:MAG: hypothetical protein JSW64_08585 [candidate division Zixibacteria bacterium]
MNNATRSDEIGKDTQPASSGKLSDLQKILKLAANSFSKEKYSMAVDYCRKAISAIHGTGHSQFAAEAYYIWCLSDLKMDKFDDARKACYEARLKLGNYLDLVYFEIVIAAVGNETERIPKLAKSFIELYNAAGDKFSPLKEKTHDRIGEVLLMGGQALEQTHKTPEALDFYKEYLTLFPDDALIKERVDILTDSLNVERVK